MLSFAKKYGKNVYSQFGEDGILEEIINRIQPKVKTAVEFGAPSWEFCSNTAYLAEKGWTVTMYDINQNTDPRIIQAEITPDNVDEVVGEPTLLSIDIDNNDYHVWKAYSGQPDIVIIEINSGVNPMSYMIPGDKGSSYRAMVQLGLDKGYFPVCHTGNLIFVRAQFIMKFPELIDFHPIQHVSLFFNTSHLDNL